MAEEKKFPTEAMLKAREAWAKKTPEEKAAHEKAVREELKRYYDGAPSPSMRRSLLGEEEQNAGNPATHLKIDAEMKA